MLLQSAQHQMMSGLTIQQRNSANTQEWRAITAGSRERPGKRDTDDPDSNRSDRSHSRNVNKPESDKANIVKLQICSALDVIPKDLHTEGLVPSIGVRVM